MILLSIDTSRSGPTASMLERNYSYAPTGDIYYPVITGDFNGDGLTDIGRCDNINFITYLSTGTGFIFGTAINNDLAKNVGYPTFNDNPMFTGDFNDDSLQNMTTPCCPL